VAEELGRLVTKISLMLVTIPLFSIEYMERISIQIRIIPSTIVAIAVVEVIVKR
jgi:hypothetical protein